jgi:cohesin complex subunit SA-1/2
VVNDFGVCCGCARSSVARSFRLAATLAAHQAVAGLIRAQLCLGEARDTAQRQLAAEERKKPSKVTTTLRVAFFYP